MRPPITRKQQLQHQLTYGIADYTNTEEELSKASAVFKTVCGVANSCAYLCVLDALDALRTHPRYRHKVKLKFNNVVRELRDYETQLKAGYLFRVEDVVDQHRNRMVPELDNSAYFDYWCGLGAAAYDLTTDQRNVMTYKITKAYKAHGSKFPDANAKVLVASKMLHIAVRVFKDCCRQAAEQNHIAELYIHHFFDELNLERIFNSWFEASIMFDTDEKQFDEVESRNIELASAQMADRFKDNDFFNDCVIRNVKDYEEVFRSKRARNQIIQEALALKSK